MYYKLIKLLEETQINYYWLGFLLADAHFTKTRLSLGLSNKDLNHLEKLNLYLDCGSKIGFYTDKLGYTRCHINIMDSYVIPKLLEKLGLSYTNKTKNPPRITIPQHLFLSLFVGFIDGDGCIRHQYGRKDCALIIKVDKSWEVILSLFKSQLIEAGLDCQVVYAGDKRYVELRISRGLYLKKLKQHSITNNLPYLNRKWDKIDLSCVSRTELASLRFSQYKELQKQGVKNKDIADLLGITKSGLYLLRKRNGDL